MDLVDQAGGTVEGVGICIEKGFQGGGDALRKKASISRALLSLKNGCQDGNHCVPLMKEAADG